LTPKRLSFIHAEVFGGGRYAQEFWFRLPCGHHFACRRILSGQVRLGRPVGIQGLPDSAKSPGFAAAVGLTIYPQFAAYEHFEPNRQANLKATGTDGYIARVGRWLKESF